MIEAGRRAVVLQGLLIGAAATVRPVGAQPVSQPKLVVLLGLTNPDVGRTVIDPLKKSMRELGSIEGRDVIYDARYAYGDVERLPTLAREVVALSPAVIWVVYTPSALAARQATSTIPIAASIADPVGAGLAQSLAKPGGNVTGISNLNVEAGAKMLEFLRQAVPGVRRVAVMFNSNNAGSGSVLRRVQSAARSASIEAMPVDIRSVGEIEPAFKRIDAERVDGIIIQGDYVFAASASKLTELLKARRFPVATSNAFLVTAGAALLGYAQNFDASTRQMASFIDRILKGAKPADLPIEQPIKLDLTINLRTAKTLGLTIPQSLLLRADAVIE